MTSAAEIAYKDKFVRSIVNSVDTGDCTGSPLLFNDPDPDAEYIIAMRLTAAQWTQIFDAIWQGAPLLFQDDYQQVVYNFVKGVECNVICDYIIQNCMSNQTFLNAISGAMANNGSLQSSAGAQVPTSENLSTVLFTLPEACDDSDRYGVCYAMVDLMDTAATDMLDILVGLTQAVDIAQELAKAIPIAGQFISTALQIADLYINLLQAQYAASYNTATHEEIACLILCEMDGACELTMDHVLAGYREAIIGDLPDLPSDASAWDEIAQYLQTVLGAFADLVVVGVYHWLILMVMVRGSKWVQSTSRLMTIALGLYSPIAPPAECECGEWVYKWGDSGDALLSANWVIEAYDTFCTGSYDSGNDQIDFCCSDYPNGTLRLRLTITFTETQLTRMIVTQYNNDFRNLGTPTDFAYNVNGGATQFASYNPATTGETVWDTGTISETISELTFLFQSPVNNTSCPQAGIYSFLKSIELHGSGALPTWA